MANHTTANPRGRYYDAPTSIRLVEGVVHQQSVGGDEYVGTAEALAASGILARNLFPGQPGMPGANVSLRANGVAREPGQCWSWMSGYMRVSRRALDGRFQVLLNCSAEEYKRRKGALARAISEARLAPAAGTLGRALFDLGPPLRKNLRHLVRCPHFCADHRIDDRMRQAIEQALDDADGIDIERELGASLMTQAAEVIGRISGPR